MLLGQNILLRPVTSDDADALFNWENDRAHWDVSGTQKPFTKKQIKEFISNQRDIYLDKQLRLMITTILTPKSQILNPIGCIDLFEFDSKKAGIGILIDKKHRKKGYAAEALNLLTDYCFNTLNLTELFCNISEDNTASLALFKKCKFKRKGKKKNICSLVLQRK